MKKISVLIPTYNEEDNVVPLSSALIEVFNTDLPNYDYEIVYIDNDSKDKTRLLIREICSDNSKIKAIFNSKNFGYHNSPFYGLCQTNGDCTILMCADFQDPVDMIPKFVREWENGYKIVCGIKTKSEERRLMYFLRSCYYKTVKKLSKVEQIEHFTGFGLYDNSFIETLKNLGDPSPFLRGIVAELGSERKEISYTQNKRNAGKSKSNWLALYDAAMLSFTSYTKAGLRVAVISGFVFSALSLFALFIYIALSLFFWRVLPAGMLPVLLGVFVFGSLQLFFIGLVGEYIMSINSRVMNRPLVVEMERINFHENFEQMSNGQNQADLSYKE